MFGALAISVRLYEGCYHGAGDWPPSPARLLQALVAGAARGATLVEQDRFALLWLETLVPPLIAAPRMRAGRGFRNFVPNNDLDAVGGDLKRLGKIRAAKQIRPILFDAEVPLLYLWAFQESREALANAKRVCAIAERLYQLGRGVDMAWSWADIIDESEVEGRLARYCGAIYHPAKGRVGLALRCPQPGSLKSLQDRFRANGRRFSRSDSTGGQVFSQPPPARFRMVSYDSPPARLLFDILSAGGENAETEFAPWPLARAVELVTGTRDRAAFRLKEGLPGTAALIERVLIARDANEADKATRVRIVPLPSIGHTHADHAIRRVLVEVPPNCPLSAADVRWGFSTGLTIDHQTGEVHSELVPASDGSILGHYGIGHPARVWRTVTPVALPRAAPRRPTAQPARRKGAPERIAEEQRAAGAIAQALRHAGVDGGAIAIRVQREPFAGSGERAEAFAHGAHFVKERLWHVEITFAQPQHGPLIIGDGRYLGLGLMRPAREAWRDVAVFRLGAEAGVATADRGGFLQAVRRALMALARRDDGRVPRLFSGHEDDGRPAQSGRHEHVFLSATDRDEDGYIDTLIVSAPWKCDHSVRPNANDAELLDRTVGLLERVRAGRLGVISLLLDPRGSDDFELMGPAHTWESHADYCPTRAAAGDNDPASAFRLDAVMECRRRGLPAPEVQLLSHCQDNTGRLQGRLLLSFAAAVPGPIMIGRDSHQGGGLFLAAR